MKIKEMFQFLVSYLKFRFKGIMIFCLFCIMFAFVFFLYNIPVEPVGYASMLCAFIGVIFVIVDLFNLYKSHKLLLHLKGSIILNISKLPEPKHFIEKDYKDLLSILHLKYMEASHDADMRQNNLMDYYTLWAHQIKTPIAAMRLILQSEETKKDSELSMELFKIEQYVEFVLQYLRVESMSSDLMLKKYCLDDIIKQAVRKYAKIFIIKKIRLDFKALNCEVLTDEKWMLFVIEQILSNALEYTIEGTISIYMEDLSGKTLVIEDTGIGINEDDLTRIFERGFTGYNGRWDKKSTGLGLYLCNQILTRLSHSITIKSQVDRGTKVMIDLATIEVDVE